MKTILSFLIALFLFTTIGFGQSQTVTSTTKNKIMFKVKNLQKENDALSVDRILIQCDNIYSSKTNFKSGVCEIIADTIVSTETIGKCLLNSGYLFEIVSIKPMTDREVETELNSTDNNNKFIKHVK